MISYIRAAYKFGPLNEIIRNKYKHLYEDLDRSENVEDYSDEKDPEELGRYMAKCMYYFKRKDFKCFY